MSSVTISYQADEYWIDGKKSEAHSGHFTQEFVPHGDWSTWSAFDAVAGRFKQDVGYLDETQVVPVYDPAQNEALESLRSQRDLAESKAKSLASELAITQSLLEASKRETVKSNEVIAEQVGIIAGLERSYADQESNLNEWAEDYDELVGRLDEVEADRDELREDLEGLQFIAGLWSDLVIVLQEHGLHAPGEGVVEAVGRGLKARKAEAAAWINAHFELAKEFGCAETAWETERQLLVDERDAALWDLDEACSKADQAEGFAARVQDELFRIRHGLSGADASE